jgi:hypothetical protein
VRLAWAADAVRSAADAVRSAADDGTPIVQAAQFALSADLYPPWISGGDRL